jgi:hypothetical protein
MRGMGGGGGCCTCGVSANEFSCVHGAQINFRDLTPYLDAVVEIPVFYMHKISLAENT